MKRVLSGLTGAALALAAAGPAAADYSLIVDAMASVIPTREGSQLLLTSTRAVLHRPVPAPETAPSSCGADCVPLSLGAKR